MMFSVGHLGGALAFISSANLASHITKFYKEANQYSGAIP
jgi:hypothetical protein